VLQPILVAALHLVQTIGPHVVELNEQIRQIDRIWATKAPGLRHSSSAVVSDLNKLLADHRATNTPLPMLEEHDVSRILTAGWDANNPLLPVSTGALARQAGHVQFWAKWMPALRKPLMTPSTLSESRRSSPATPQRHRPSMTQPCCPGHCHCTDPKRSP
jgi:hypothetical protein